MATLHMPYSFRVLAVASLAIALAPGAQMLKPTPQQMLTSLQETGHLATLESADAVPFRLSATFSIRDYTGKPVGEGTLEERWLKPEVAQRNITFLGAHSQQLMKNGSVRELAEGFTSTYLERRIIAALLDPVPESKGPVDLKRLSYRALKLRSGTLDCTVVTAATPVTPTANEVGPATAYCTDPVTHILRLRQERYDFIIVYNNIVRLGGHTLAKRVETSQHGTLRATLKVTGFAAAPDLTEASFVVPANATDMSQVKIEVPEEVIAGSNIKKKQPVYPEQAKRNGVSGKVFLSAVISKTGDVTDLDVISSPSPDLTESAIAAVRQWKYKPYLVGGKPQDVDTTIRVNYSFR